MEFHFSVRYSDYKYKLSVEHSSKSGVLSQSLLACKTPYEKALVISRADDEGSQQLQAFWRRKDLHLRVLEPI